MTYGQVKNESLKLINGYSIAGTTIASSYNNQADYIARIPGLVEEAQYYMATTARPIPERVPFSSLTKTQYGSSYLVDMPSNCWQLTGAGIMHFLDNGSNTSLPPFERYHRYKQAENNSFVIPVNEVNRMGEDTLIVEYYRYPVSLGDNPEDSVSLDNKPEVQRIIPYYVAAHLIMFDDYSIYVSLWNEFETMLSRLSTQLRAETWSTIDVYDAGSWGDGDVY